MDFPFVGLPSFLRSMVSDVASLEADIAVVGVPFDEGSPFMPGSRFGPRSIREHSLRFVTDGHGYYDPESRRPFLEHEMTEGRIADVGDADILPTNVLDSFANITALTRAVLDRGAMPVAWEATIRSAFRWPGHSRAPSRSPSCTSTPTSTTCRSSTAWSTRISTPSGTSGRCRTCGPSPRSGSAASATRR